MIITISLDLQALFVYIGRKLQQAHEQQQFERAVKDMEIWLDEVDKQLSADELGKVSSTENIRQFL